MSSFYPFLFQRAVFPVLDRLNRTHVWRTYQELEESQWWSRGELLDLQERKLGGVLSWTREQSPFYRDHWKRASSGRRAASEYPALDGLPIVTKEDLRGAAEAFPLPGHSGRSVRVRTSGSTGHPMTFHRSLEQESWFWALRLRMWSWAGYVPGEPYLTLNLNPRSDPMKRLQDVLFRCHYHGFNANEHDVSAVIELLRAGAVQHVVGYASSLDLLAREVAARGEGFTGIRSLLATGDALLPLFRERIESVFGTGAVDYYGAGGEGLHLASQCEERGGYHIHPENACLEVLVDGRPAKPGERGEIVVTQLDNRAMPLVRYATADAAIVEEDRTCPCGRQLRLLREVVGRVADTVRSPDGSVLVVHFFTILFEHLDGIEQFQVVQREEDRILVRLVAKGGIDRANVEARVRDAVSNASSQGLAVEFEYPAEIPLAPSLKRRLVICELADR